MFNSKKVAKMAVVLGPVAVLATSELNQLHSTNDQCQSALISAQGAYSSTALDLRTKIDDIATILKQSSAQAQQITDMTGQLNALKAEIPQPDPQEAIVTGKYPHRNLHWGAYYPFNHPECSVRHLLQWWLAGWQTIEWPIWHDMAGLSNDLKVQSVRDLVRANIAYVSDQENYGVPDYWQEAQSIWALRKDDCDGGAVLIANGLLKAGIPYYRVRLCVGNVLVGNVLEGHCYCTYLRDDGNWVAVDWCFGPTTVPIDQLPPHKDDPMYNPAGLNPVGTPSSIGYSSVMFSWDLKYSYALDSYQEAV